MINGGRTLLINTVTSLMQHLSYHQQRFNPTNASGRGCGSCQHNSVVPSFLVSNWLLVKRMHRVALCTLHRFSFVINCNDCVCMLVTQLYLMSTKRFKMIKPIGSCVIRMTLVLFN